MDMPPGERMSSDDESGDEDDGGKRTVKKEFDEGLRKAGDDGRESRLRREYGVLAEV